jgi:hypothetical protein
MVYFVQYCHCVKCYANQTAPAYHYRQPSPTFLWQHYLHHFKEISSIIKLTFPILKSKGNYVCKIRLIQLNHCIVFLKHMSFLVF